MGRRVGVTLAILAAAVFVAAESAFACKFFDGLFRRCRVQSCCVRYYCPVEVVATYCEPVVVSESAVLKPTPAEPAVEEPAPVEIPKEAPPVEAPPTLPEAPVEPGTADEPGAAPGPEKPAEPPVAEPAVTPPAVEPPAVTPPAVEPPAVTPPAIEPPAVTPPAAEPKKDDDPFGKNDSRGIRLWTDITGKYSVEARFVSFTDGTARLQKSNGRYVRVAVDKLSLMDQQLVRLIETVATAR